MTTTTGEVVAQFSRAQDPKRFSAILAAHFGGDTDTAKALMRGAPYRERVLLHGNTGAHERVIELTGPVPVVTSDAAPAVVRSASTTSAAPSYASPVPAREATPERSVEDLFDSFQQDLADDDFTAFCRQVERDNAAATTRAAEPARGIDMDRAFDALVAESRAEPGDVVERDQGAPAVPSFDAFMAEVSR